MPNDNVLTDEQIIEAFEAEIKNDPDAYTRPDECVYQITAKELIRASRALLATPQPEPRAAGSIPRVHGISRFADNPCTVLVMLMAEATDDALRAIHDRLTCQPEPRAEVTDADLAALLPGTYYMNPPDGGDVSLLEQLRRMAEDAARYRWLRDEDCGVPDGMREICAVQFRLPHTEEPDTDLFDVALDAAIDAARRTTPDREAIIEECAKVCDEYAADQWSLYKGRAPYNGSEPGRADPDVQGRSDGADVCAERIRALKTAPTPTQLAALDRLAENERELGLDYMTAPTSDKGGA
ncbi:hypothetical protein NTJ56_08600 [Burkholderia contaminans]|uniref:hypothetical protein n=1 Tax=Burkholderia contaminans TaxID=488447 RepID=UPI00214FE466|nr:hypothetical protein [Burkholderia contaminans]UUX38846.1 hypothetical protein NTJ56_08600 [Burkholderia contaminans]